MGSSADSGSGVSSGTASSWTGCDSVAAFSST